MRPEISIRLASIDDAPSILQLWQGSAIWLQSKGIEQWNPDRFRLESVIRILNDGSDVYLAEKNGQIAGTYFLTWSDPFLWAELDDSDSGYIHRLAVHRMFKGEGNGAVLLKFAEEHIRANGKTKARLDCMADNPRLNQYYRDLGFRFIGRVDREGWSANLYEKHLS